MKWYDFDPWGWLIDLFAGDVAELVPTAHGGHPDRCHHYKHRCRCATCTQMMADCNRKSCQRRAVERRKQARAKLTGHG